MQIADVFDFSRIIWFVNLKFEPICFEMQWIEQHVGSWSFMRSAKEWQLGRFWCWSLGMGQWGKCLGSLWPLVALGRGPIDVHQGYVCGFSYSF